MMNLLLINDSKYTYNPSSALVLIDYCMLNGIEIPRFCYHEKLSIAGNCRMCLIEDSKSIKPVIACSSQLFQGMRIYTDTLKVKRAREGVLEFLLINHPLDCPICDQGGECDSQDLTIVFGSDRGRFYEYKRAVEDKNCGPFVKTIMNRCIHCTRCVRFAVEILGFNSLGISGRGSRMEIGTYVEKIITGNLSGNLIDLCPVGALTSKPYSFTGRSWELSSFSSLSIFDIEFPKIRLDIRGNDVLRILPVPGTSHGEDWITDESRFFYDSLKKQRILVPLVQHSLKKFIRFSWERIFIYIQKNFINIISYIVKNNIKYHAIIANSAPNSTLQSLFSTSFFVNVFGGIVPSHYRTVNQAVFSCLNIYCFHDFDLWNSKVLILKDLNLRYLSPILAIRVRKSVLKFNKLVYSFGASVNYGFYIKDLGNSNNLLFSFIEGRHWVCHLIQRWRSSCFLVRQHSMHSQNSLFLLRNFCSKLKLRFFPENHKEIVSNVFSLGTAVHNQNSIFFPLFQKFTIGSNFNFSVFPSNKNLYLYLGYHGDFFSSFNNLILPETSIYESNGIFINYLGVLKSTLKPLSKISKYSCTVENFLQILVFYLNNKSKMIKTKYSFKSFLKFFNNSRWLFKSTFKLNSYILSSYSPSNISSSLVNYFFCSNILIRLSSNLSLYNKFLKQNTKYNIYLNEFKKSTYIV